MRRVTNINYRCPCCLSDNYLESSRQDFLRCKNCNAEWAVCWDPNDYGSLKLDPQFQHTWAKHFTAKVEYLRSCFSEEEKKDLVRDLRNGNIKQDLYAYS